MRRAIDVIHSRLYYLKDKVVANMRQRSESKEGSHKELDKSGNVHNSGDSNNNNKETKVRFLSVCLICANVFASVYFFRNPITPRKLCAPFCWHCLAPPFRSTLRKLSNSPLIFTIKKLLYYSLLEQSTCTVSLFHLRDLFHAVVLHDETCSRGIYNFCHYFLLRLEPVSTVALRASCCCVHQSCGLNFRSVSCLWY